MALDDLLSYNFGVLNGFLLKAMKRWRDAANDARKPAYTVDDLFTNMREQFVDNWDTWNDLMSFTGSPVTPTVIIKGQAGAIQGRNGSAWVSQRLTGLTSPANLASTDLDRLGGGATIAAQNVAIAFKGDFDGQVEITVNDPVNTAGTYH